MILCTVIFIGVFAFMFYSVYAHRKSKGHKAAQFHENTTVEILWTVIPADHPRVHRAARPRHGGRAEGHVQPRHDHQGHRLPVEMGLRLRQGRRRGHQLHLHARHAARPDREPGAQGRELPARGRQRARGAGRQEGAHADHRSGRDPFLVGAGLRRQAGRDPGLHPRPVVQGREDRHLPQPVRRAVRQGARLHADRGRGGERRRNTASGSARR